ncbi:MAG: HAMP domain-containing histidine kinase [Anaerolineales bacterium]|nr:HAMP domain-containing histidine kinase [Anaerolineales bacterium]
MSIRLKVALPYVLLTIVVTLIGVYVVTQLVTGTLNERLTNQLLESGRSVSDAFVRQESYHVEEARRLVYIQGLAEALRDGDRETALTLIEPSLGVSDIENVILITRDGEEFLHLIQNGDDKAVRVEQDTRAEELPIVTPFLQRRNPEDPPRRTFGVNLFNEVTYYYTSMPVLLDGRFEGVVIVGTSIDTLIPAVGRLALADVVLYGNNGQIMATTLGVLSDAEYANLTISDAQYQFIIRSEEIVTGENLTLSEREFTLGRAPLQIGNDRIGVFAVLLPSDYVTDFGETSRLAYAAIFTALMIAVITIGTLVARTIIRPLYKLVKTSQAIASGDLNRRTGIDAKDEIGTLANNFDEMTARLQERTLELERANAVLQRMDKTKSNFIQISAHELRTPLTLIMGYSQMLEQDAQKDPELASLARGILEGAERMTGVVESMLDASRIDSDALVVKKINLEVEPIIIKVYKGYEKAFEDRKIDFETHGLADLPYVSADPELLQKVFSHLVMNAIKFTPDGGKVKISGRYLNGNEPPQVEIEVLDTGIGIDPEMKDLIFEKFNQTGEVLMHSSGKTKFKGGGPGLGLAIARGIIQAHGGRIRVESKGHDEIKLPGSKFIVSLPVVKGTEKTS